ncbi:hypothetical protein H696_04620 [Fonticula alba]|uniref:Membrane insertase YidC/Oxa/ALB C-terminal domain-containing protein n=1 Tax=Fonticula alba TaxID=691883 RepID=A0A058Z5I8_FONAL|nr:hypothetical protein H696_04620 [Fonticula alba]KCV69208.1 hypothetical protein H696_04620 [Fonticula alba]|eukprot:XP_009496779.1 hypothetical protein H696_04620 [Fonticula alba]
MARLGASARVVAAPLASLQSREETPARAAAAPAVANRPAVSMWAVSRAYSQHSLEGMHSAGMARRNYSTAPSSSAAAVAAAATPSDAPASVSAAVSEAAAAAPLGSASLPESLAAAIGADDTAPAHVSDFANYDLTNKADLYNYGLDGFFRGYFSEFLNVLHFDAGLPWWGAILGLSVGIRVVAFPFLARQVRASAVMQNMMPQMSVIRMEMEAAQRKGDKAKAAEATQKIAAMFTANKVNPLSPVLYGLLPTPFFVGTFMALNQSVLMYWTSSSILTIFMNNALRRIGFLRRMYDIPEMVVTAEQRQAATAIQTHAAVAKNNPAFAQQEEQIRSSMKNYELRQKAALKPNHTQVMSSTRPRVAPKANKSVTVNK